MSYIKQTGTLTKRCFSAGVMDQWKELDEEIAAVDMVGKFKRQLGQFGY